MKEQFEKLLNILNEYNKLYDTVLENSKKKLNIVKVNKFADFTDINIEENVLLNKIKFLENNRFLLIRNLSKKLGLPENSKLDILLEHCNDNNIKKLILIKRDELKKKLLEVSDNNKKLSVIINKSLNVINFSIDLLLNEDIKKKKEAYTKDGKGIKKNDKKFKRLDLKA